MWHDVKQKRIPLNTPVLVFCDKVNDNGLYEERDFYTVIEISNYDYESDNGKMADGSLGWVAHPLSHIYISYVHPVQWATFATANINQVKNIT